MDWLSPCFPLPSVIWRPEYALMPMPRATFGDWGHALTCEEDLVAALKILEPVLHLLVLSGYEIPEIVIRVQPAKGPTLAESNLVSWRLESMQIEKFSLHKVDIVTPVQGILMRLRPTALALPIGTDEELFGKRPRADDYAELTGQHVDGGWLIVRVTDTDTKSWSSHLSQQVGKLIATLKPKVAKINPNSASVKTLKDVQNYTGLTHLLRSWMWTVGKVPDAPLPGRWTAFDELVEAAFSKGFSDQIDHEVATAQRNGLPPGTAEEKKHTAFNQLSIKQSDASWIRLVFRSLNDGLWWQSQEDAGDAPDPAEQFPDTLCDRASLAQFLLYAHFLGMIDVLGAGRWAPTPAGQLVERLVIQAPSDQRGQARKVIPLILRDCVKLNVTYIPQVAYILATARHESGFGSSPVEKRFDFNEDKSTGIWSAVAHAGSKAAVSASSKELLELEYWWACYGESGHTASKEDARDFRGRGLVQLTHRENYGKMTTSLTLEKFEYALGDKTWGTTSNPIDLETHFDHVNRSMELASMILVIGMSTGGFSGEMMSTYLPTDGSKVDYLGARWVVNSQDKAELIKGYAVAFQKILEANGIWDKVIQDIKDGKA